MASKFINLNLRKSYLGVFLEQIKFYDAQVSDKNCEIRTKLHKMTEAFASITQRVTELNNNEL